MIWLFARGDAEMKIETRFNSTSQAFELIWHEADGSVRCETFATESDFHGRLTSVGAALRAERWQQSGPPTFDLDGWRIS